jgi:TatD DNase family protein
MSRYVDIGANLLDPMFRGFYRSAKRKHPADLDAVLARASAAGVRAIIVTATDLRDSVAAVRLCRRVNARREHACRLYSTVGVHPLSTAQLDFRAPPRSRHGDGSEGDDDGSPPLAVPTNLEEYVAALRACCADGVSDGTVVAVGE